MLIEHELAGVLLRGVAFGLDQFFLLLFFLFNFILLASFGINGQFLDYYVYTVIIPVYFLYSLLFEIFMFGQTPGKRVVGIKCAELMVMK